MSFRKSRDSPLVSADKQSDSDNLFDWAETQHPELFSPPNQTSQTSDGYYYRYYSETKNYVGTHTTDLDVYVLGDTFDGLIRIDTLEALMVSSGLSSNNPDYSGGATNAIWLGYDPIISNSQPMYFLYYRIKGSLTNTSTIYDYSIFNFGSEIMIEKELDYSIVDDNTLSFSFSPFFEYESSTSLYYLFPSSEIALNSNQINLSSEIDKSQIFKQAIYDISDEYAQYDYVESTRELNSFSSEDIWWYNWNNGPYNFTYYTGNKGKFMIGAKLKAFRIINKLTNEVYYYQ